MKAFLATCILAGTIIGAGIFSLPYVVSQLGLVLGFLFLYVFFVIYLLVHRMYADLLAKESGTHDFSFLAHKYFKPFSARITTWIVILELTFVLLVYLTVAPGLLKISFGVEGTLYLLVFWLISSLFIFLPLRFTGIAHALATIAIVGIVGLAVYSGFSKPLVTSPFESMNLALFFLPFGPLLFSFSGRPAISKVVEEQKEASVSGHWFPLKRVIFWGTAIPAILYAVFIISVLKMEPHPLPEALKSVSLPADFLRFFGILGLLATWTSYFMAGKNIRDILYKDRGVPSWIGYLIPCVLPIVMFFTVSSSFFLVLSLTGGVFLACEGICIIMMWRNAFPKNQWRRLAPILVGVFFLSICYEIGHFFGLI
jgi:amino acid permease